MHCRVSRVKYSFNLSFVYRVILIMFFKFYFLHFVYDFIIGLNILHERGPEKSKEK